MVKYLAAGASMGVAVGFLLLFTTPGRRVTVCPVYERTRSSLLRRPGMADHLQRRWDEATPKHVSPVAGWVYVKVAGGSLPLPPGTWEMAPLTSRLEPTFRVFSRAPDNRVTVLFSVNERKKRYETGVLGWLMKDLAGAHDIFQAMYSRDLSQPCDPRKSFRSTFQEYILMKTKAGSINPEEIQQLYQNPKTGGLFMVLKSAGPRPAWGVSAYIPIGPNRVHATYILESDALVPALQDQLTLVGDPTLSDKPLPTNLKQLATTLHDVRY